MITGVNGFVGSRLASALKDKGFLVRGTMRRRESFPADNLHDIVEVGNLEDYPDWGKVLGDVDVVVHLAARVHVMRERGSDPLAEFRKVNVEGTRWLAQKAASAGVRRFVFLSSVKAMGEESDQRYTELSECRPGDAYGLSKLEAEEVLRQIEGETGMGVVVLRPPLVYGPGVKGNFLSMMKFTYYGLPLPVRRVQNLRSLVYLENLVDAISVCIEHPNAAGETYLVSDGSDISTEDLANSLYVGFDNPSRLIPCPKGFLVLGEKLLRRPGMAGKLVGSLIVDSSKIRSELGWDPPYTVAEGLSETVKWYKGKGSTGRSVTAQIDRG